MFLGALRTPTAAVREAVRSHLDGVGNGEIRRARLAPLEQTAALLPYREQRRCYMTLLRRLRGAPSVC